MLDHTPLLLVSHIYKSFASMPVLRDVSIHTDEGEIVCLLGPSGCGKTTLLRIIAGLEAPDAGTVTFDGRDLASVPIHQRGFGLMFQDFALFPHKNVWENVIFGLRMQNQSADQTRQQALAALALVGLTGFETRDVNDLSGGEKQRVALARSLAPRPRLLMLDEPLGSLDRKLREELMNELRAILKRAGLTSIYVTHDQQEAFAIADRVAIMNVGRIEQIGAPQEVYARPASEFVARFMGMSNLLKGTLVAPNVIRTPIGDLTWDQPATRLSDGQTVTVLIRPDTVSLDLQPDGNSIEGTLVDASFRGRYNRIVVRAKEIDLTFEVDARERIPAIHEDIQLSLRRGSLIVLR